MMKTHLTTNPKKRPIMELEETEVPRIRDTTMNDETQEEDREIEEMIGTCRSTPREESSQEETCMGMRGYPRCRNIWDSRRNT